MIDHTHLPALNATLNAISTVLLSHRLRLHPPRQIGSATACMIAALVTSALFLTSYLIYHAQVGSVPFQGRGVRTVYFTILIPHVILAAAIVPLVLITRVARACGRYDKHRRIARWTLPIWLYVR